MIQKLTQKHRHDPDNGSWGDCWRTCIAMILGRPLPEEVPHFCDRGLDAEASFAAADAWLSSRNLQRLNVNWTGDLAGVLTWHRDMQPGMAYTLIGTSRNGTNHCVVCIGGEIFCDPSIDQSGIVGPAADGHYWTEYLVYKARGFHDPL